MGWKGKYLVRSGFRLYRKIIRRCREALLFLSGTDYWQYRARRYGVRGVLNVNYDDGDYSEVTKRQKGLLFPLLREHLNGNEKTIVDFGCGPGRFTPGLAEITGAHVIGLDPVEYYVRNAPRAENVEYHVLSGHDIPVKDRSVDVLWVCLVLGGITVPTELRFLAREFERVLASDGILFCAENTSRLLSGRYWKFRSVKFYQELLPFIDLRLRTRYKDLGEVISVLCGRRRST